jgi:hypothetical protein
MSSTDNEPGTIRLAVGCGHRKIYFNIDQTLPNPDRSPPAPLEAGVIPTETDLIVLLQRKPLNVIMVNVISFAKSWPHCLLYKQNNLFLIKIWLMLTFFRFIGKKTRRLLALVTANNYNNQIKDTF